MAAQWGQFIAGIDPTAGEYRRQQAHTQDMKAARLKQAITEMKVEEAQREIERRDRFQSSLKDIGDTYLRAPVAGGNRAGGNAKQQLLDRIASTESPDYNVMYGGNTFDSYADHPGVYNPITSGPNAGKKSSAAGRYQFLESTWDDLANRYGYQDFSPQNQDDAAWRLATENYPGGEEALMRDIQAKGVDAVLPALSGVWTSLPGGIEQAARYSNPEDAQVAEMLVNERGFPPEMVEAGQAAFNNPGANNIEAATNNMMLLMTEFPEYGGDLAPVIEGIQGMRDSDLRRAKDKLQSQIIQKIENGGVFDEDMEQLVTALAALGGDINPLLKYFQDKRSAEGKATTGFDMKADKPPEFNETRMGLMARNVIEQPEKWGKSPEDIDPVGPNMFQNAELGTTEARADFLENTYNETIKKVVPVFNGWPRDLPLQEAMQWEASGTLEENIIRRYQMQAPPQEPTVEETPTGNVMSYEEWKAGRQ